MSRGDWRRSSAAGAVLDHHQEVEAAEEDGVDVGEVDREDRVSLCVEELSPGRSGAQGSGVDAGVLQDLPDGGAGDVVAESDERAVEAAVAPGRILFRHL
jgi:hypothetical protein